MPTYTFCNVDTQEEFELFMSVSAYDQYKKENPKHEPIIGMTNIVSGANKKPDQGFRDVLKEIKNKHDATWTRSTINTF